MKINSRGEVPTSGERVFQLTQEAMDAFRGLRKRALAAGFRKELFVLTSAYRSAARQAALAADAVTKYGNKEAATWVAQGRSEHITGRAFDLYLGIDNTGENAKAGKFNGLSTFIWLKANASDFGLNAYSVEPWHWSHNMSP